MFNSLPFETLKIISKFTFKIIAKIITNGKFKEKNVSILEVKKICFEKKLKGVNILNITTNKLFFVVTAKVTKN